MGHGPSCRARGRLRNGAATSPPRQHWWQGDGAQAPSGAPPPPPLLSPQVLHSECLFRAGLLDRRLRDGAAALVACFSGPTGWLVNLGWYRSFFCHVYGLTVSHDVSWFWPAACSRAGSGSPLCAEQRPAASSRAAGGTPRTSGAADDLPVFWSRSAARRPWVERSPVVLFFFSARLRPPPTGGAAVWSPGHVSWCYCRHSRSESSWISYDYHIVLLSSSSPCASGLGWGDWAFTLTQRHHVCSWTNTLTRDHHWCLCERKRTEKCMFGSSDREVAVGPISFLRRRASAI